MLVEKFGGLLETLVGEGAELAREGRYVEFFDDYTARVRTGDGARVVRSWRPLRVGDADGNKQPVDLSLMESAGGFRPRMPLLPVWLPGSTEDALRFGEGDLAVRVEGGRVSQGARSGPSSVFYADVGVDTDVVLLPVELGAEVLWHIRSEQSPESFSLRFELPVGAALRRADDGGVEVVRGGEVLAVLRAPQVLDAQGERVAVRTGVEGERVVFSVAHRSADVAYPLALDPVIEDSRGWWLGDTSGLWDWGFWSNGSRHYFHYNCFWSPCYFGLHVYAPDNWYDHWNSGEFVYAAPGQTSYISRAEFNYMTFDWGGQCCASALGWNGMWDAGRGAWAAVSMVNWPYAYRASTLTAGPGARTAVFGKAFEGGGYRRPYTVHRLGSVLLHLEDLEAPSLGVTADQRPGAGPGGWLREGSVTVATTSQDAGLGVRRTGLDSASSVPYDATHRTLLCTGAKRAVCPATLADSYELPVATFPEGVNTMSVFAEDALGKRTTQTLTPVRVDRGAPTIALSGSLYDHRDRPLTESDTYALHVRAQEPSCAADGQRSGVARIEVQVDGIPKGTYTQPSVGRCLHEIDWTYRPADYTPGEHAITVVVTDHAGSRRMRHLRPLYTSAPRNEQVEGLAAAAGLAEEDVEIIKSPRPELPPVWRGTPFPGKGYFGSGFTQPRVAVGGGRIYVSAGNAGVKSFDLREPSATAPTTVTTTPAPGGIAYYRDELYAVADRRVDVYDPAGTKRREIGNSCRTVDDAEPTGSQVPCDSTGLDLKRPQGIDAAWGKLFVADEATTANADVTRAYTTNTGIPLGASANGDPAPSFRDVSVAPDQNLYFDAKRANTWLAGATIPWLNTGPLLDGHEPGSAPPTSAADADWCECPAIRGTDWVWGMNWLLATTNNGTRIEEFGPSVRKRTWAPKQTNGTVNDVVYHKREERLEASGNLMRSDWINHDQQLFYVASDADIYVLGAQGEHWYEQARTFSYLELLIRRKPASDDQDPPLFQAYPFSVDGVPTDAQHRHYDPAGLLTFDTHELTVPGTYELQLKAHFTDREPLTETNTELRIDHAPPAGRLDSLPYAVRGTVMLTGDLADEHRGPKDWTTELVPRNGSEWSEACPDEVRAPGPYLCAWDTNTVDDGHYRLHAGLADLMTDKHPNTRDSDEVETIVDNHGPSIVPSGLLYEARDQGALAAEETARLVLEVHDAAAGATRVVTSVDGAPQHEATQSCPAGGCSLTDSYDFVPGQFAPGEHSVEVAATDGAGNTSKAAWTIVVEDVVPGDTADPADAAAGDVEYECSTDNGCDPTGGSPAPSATAMNSGLAAPVAVAPTSKLGEHSSTAGTVPTSYLACTAPNQPLNFESYSIGSQFAIFPLTRIGRYCSLPDPLRDPWPTNYVSYIYGDCTPGPEGPCAPPVEVQSWPSCIRNVSQYTVGPGHPTLDPDSPYPHSKTTINGLPAVVFDGGLQIELYTGRTTIDVYGTDPSVVLEAAGSLEAAPPIPTTPVPAPWLTVPSLPPPVAGAMEGTLGCTT
ncbi:MAG: hypothetical protein M3141_00165 [Actinomycetota bacterium]|nr:hypothetical protein [Actinomycetota bacterium]